MSFRPSAASGGICSDYQRTPLRLPTPKTSPEFTRSCLGGLAYGQLTRPVEGSLFDIRYSPSPIRRSTFIIRYSLFAIPHPPSAVRHSLFDIRYSPFLPRHSSVVIRYSPPLTPKSSPISLNSHQCRVRFFAPPNWLARGPVPRAIVPRASSPCILTHRRFAMLLSPTLPRHFPPLPPKSCFIWLRSRWTRSCLERKIVWAEGQIRATRGVIWTSGAPNDFSPSSESRSTPIHYSQEPQNFPRIFLARQVYSLYNGSGL